MSKGEFVCDCGRGFETKKGLDTHRGLGCDRITPAEEVIGAVRDLADELGRTPKMMEMEELGRYSVQVCRDRFGGWNATLRAAGFEPNARHGIPREELIEELHRLTEELGRTAREAEMVEHGRFDPSAYRRVFGTWGGALDAAGLEIDRSRKQYTDDELLTHLKEFTESLGHTPTAREMFHEGEFSDTLYLRRFGTWNEALDAADIESRPYYGRHRDPSIQDLYMGPLWQQKRRAVRERYDFMCQACGITEAEHLEEHGRELAIHHIIGRQQFLLDDGTVDYERADALDNLVPLCNRCHPRWEGIPLRPQLAD